MMKAIQLVKPENFTPIEIAEPGPPGPDQALVRVHRIGICGTDIAGYLGKMPFYSYPRIPGHELGVEVLSVGRDVTKIAVGDRCSVEPYMNCQTCYACKRGGINCCVNLQVLGVHIDGGMRPQFLLPARKLHKSDQLAFDQLALVETLAIGCHAVDRGAAEAGEHALVIGAGPIGLSVIEFLRLAQTKITVLDLNSHRLDFCRTVMGVQETIELKGDGAELKRLDEITGGALPTLVIDATGNARSMSNAFNYVGHTGRLVFVGITTGNVTFADPLLHRREMTVKGSRNALPQDFDRIIRLIEEGKIDTRPWITHRCRFDDLIDQFPSYTRPETGVIKAIVEM